MLFICFLVFQVGFFVLLVLFGLGVDVVNYNVGVKVGENDLEQWNVYDCQVGVLWIKGIQGQGDCVLVGDGQGDKNDCNGQ